MIKQLTISIVAFLLFLTSCERKFEHESKFFEKYLETTFAQSIKVDMHYYLIVSKFGCPSCISKTLNEVAKRLDDTNTKYFTILTYDSLIVPKQMNLKLKVLFDSEAKYEHLNFPLANITIIQTQDLEIEKIKVVNLDEIDRVINEVFVSLY